MITTIMTTTIKTLTIRLSVPVFLLFFVSCVAFPPKDSFTYIQIISVIDGDTFKAHISGVNQIFNDKAVRVAHIDTPEIHSSKECEKIAGLQSKTRLEELLKASRIDLINIEFDKYGRVLGDVIADGVNVGEKMVGEGL